MGFWCLGVSGLRTFFNGCVFFFGWVMFGVGLFGFFFCLL